MYCGTLRCLIHQSISWREGLTCHEFDHPEAFEERRSREAIEEEKASLEQATKEEARRQCARVREVKQKRQVDDAVRAREAKQKQQEEENAIRERVMKRNRQEEIKGYKGERDEADTTLRGKRDVGYLSRFHRDQNNV